MAKTEFPLRAKTERGYGGILTQHGFIVTMPAHALGAVMVKIAEAGVVGTSRPELHQSFEMPQFCGPREGGFGGAGVNISECSVPKPGHLPGSLNDFAEDDDLLVLPWHGFNQTVKSLLGLAWIQYRAVVVNLAIEWQKIAFGICFKQ